MELLVFSISFKRNDLIADRPALIAHYCLLIEAYYLLENNEELVKTNNHLTMLVCEFCDHLDKSEEGRWPLNWSRECISSLQKNHSYLARRLWQSSLNYGEKHGYESSEIKRSLEYFRDTFEPKTSGAPSVKSQSAKEIKLMPNNSHNSNSSSGDQKNANPATVGPAGLVSHKRPRDSLSHSSPDLSSPPAKRHRFFKEEGKSEVSGTPINTEGIVSMSNAGISSESNLQQAAVSQSSLQSGGAGTQLADNDVVMQAEPSSTSSTINSSKNVFS